MANAYATFANGGVRANVHVIKKVEDRTGEDPKIYDVVNTDALDPDIDSDVSYAMQQVVAERHRAGRARSSAARRPARPAPPPTTRTRSPRRGSSASRRSARRR